MTTEDKPAESLSPEELRVRVAEMCGLELIREDDGQIDIRFPQYLHKGYVTVYGSMGWTSQVATLEQCEKWIAESKRPSEVIKPATSYEDVPDYATSLDAMATAESTLTDEERERYTFELWIIAQCASCPVDPADDKQDADKYHAAVRWRIVNATAEQRARAFLKAKEGAK